MGLHRYRSINFRPGTRARIAQAVDILGDYPGQRLTSRQVYYQFVARGLLDNNERNYKLTTGLLADARYAGLIDWDAIEDRGREPDSPSEWDTIGGLVESALRAFRLPRWKGQKNYVELWVEKQALAGVLAPLAREFHVTLMVNKGYSSSSAMKESADRMIEAAGSDENAKGVVLFYLGDHDPSGEDMVRDIGARLKEFGVLRLNVVKLALTMAQIKRFNPPPNPAKLSDSRAKEYVRKFGNHSWELDALPPNELIAVVRGAFRGVLDRPAMDAVVAEETRLKTALRESLNKINRTGVGNKRKGKKKR